MSKRFVIRLLSMIAVTASVLAALSALKDIPTIWRDANGSIISIIMSDDGGPVAQGSGFVVGSDGLILTNYHVINEGSSGVVKFPNGASYVVDGILGFDKVRDVAVVKIFGRNLRPVTLGNSDRIQIGEDVVAIGNPRGLESTVSNGIVSGVRLFEGEGGKYLQVTAPISPGSSGGALFNMQGEVIGITTAHLEGGENLNFAIPINEVVRLLRTPPSLSKLPSRQVACEYLGDQRDKEKENLLAAITNGNSESVRRILSAGCLTANDALEMAAEWGQDTVLQYLLKYGATPTAALNDAVREHHESTARILLREGANPNDGTLTVAASQDDVSMIRLLIQSGAKATGYIVSVPHWNGNGVREYEDFRVGGGDILAVALAAGKYIQETDPRYGRPRGTSGNHPREIDHIDKCHDTDVPHKIDERINSEDQLFPSVELLLKNGARPSDYYFGTSPMCVAVARDEPRSASLLMQYGADPTIINCVCWGERTAFSLAQKLGRSEVLAAFQQHGPAR